MNSNNPNSGTPAPNSSNNTPMTDSSPPKYVPQFSAATEMILKRIQSGAGGSSLSSIGSLTGPPPPGYDEMKRSVLMGMKTSMNMELPTLPQNTGRRTQRDRQSVGSSSSAPKKVDTPTPAGQKNGTPASGAKGKKTPAKSSKKRKRQEESSEELESDEESDVMSKLGGDSDSDGSGSITNFPKVTQSGRAIVKPTQFVPEVRESNRPKRGPSKKAQEQALCKRCGRGHSPESNMIVFCDGCNGGWHQMCHDPVVSDEAVKDETAPWFCADCTQKRARKSGSHDQAQPRVSWQGRSSDDKRAFFNSLPQQQLVSLLMQACILYPNIPIFPPVPNSQPVSTYVPQQNSSRPSSSQHSHPSQSQKKNSHTPQPFPASATAGLFARAEANPNAPIAFIRKIATGKNAAKNSSTPPAAEFKLSNSAPPQLQVQGMAIDTGDESRESTPNSPPYPKPGNGLMAKLGPDEDDMEWLVDDSDFQAFSHTLYEELNGPILPQQL